MTEASDSEFIFPPYGFVRLAKMHGDELDIVNAARVSYAKESIWKERSPVTSRQRWVLEDEDASLLRYLVKNRHGSPFEHVMLQFHVRAPKDVFYEWHRHRVASYNEESGRYVEMRPHFYHPAGPAIREQVGKPGNYSYQEIIDPEVRALVDYAFSTINGEAYALYGKMLAAGVAKELARKILPDTLYKEMRVTMNVRGLMNFLSLRAAPDAMYEIRHYAYAIEEIFKRELPVVWQAWIDNGRMAP